MRNKAKIDASADSMKAVMQSERRKLEAEYGAMMCCTHGCENEAHPQSCYCEPCELADLKAEEEERLAQWA